MSEAARWLLYGANGFTGKLIAEECARRGLSPILAGRREDAIRPLAERLGLSWRVFSLDRSEAIARELEGVGAALLCAGPFSRTSAPFVDACLRSRRHYLDITGEVEVLEAVHARDAEARAAECVLMPAVGFDVVPSDCLAASLKRALPDATRLELAFYGIAEPGPGTLKTMIEGIERGGAVRRDGKIVRVPIAWKRRSIPFHDEARLAVTIPWGDLATAYRSTGIPNIEVYMAAPRAQLAAVRVARRLSPVLRAAPVRRAANRFVERWISGPDERARAGGHSEFWGCASSGDRSVEGTASGPEGYDLTVRTSIESVLRVLRGDVAPGAWTPSSAFGASFFAEIDGCTIRVGEPERR